ncbi:helix-turn-helix domain-containing protein [Amycolatopsis anabasis]|uniref:helix-turn-helix domain-containing protein n=1 Tax=Amycolatopsis anabasis TaxID=1840409 RepID=UPI00131C93D2|nr:helix-turn-helix transcriptional regulator [Amycolatopsis anabasis]
MKDREPTIRSRELGDGLRKWMVAAGFTGREIAKELEWPDSKVSRLLTGKRGASEADVAAFLVLCKVPAKERARLLALRAEHDKPGWLQQFGKHLPAQLRTLVDHEDTAKAITDFQPMVIPGILQTPEYARALLTGTGTLPSEEIDSRVSARMARKSLFGRPSSPQFTFFIHEFALQLPVGGAEVMSEQLHYLLQMSVRPYISLRVIPVEAGVHAGIAGAFKLMEFEEFKPVVYLDSETASLFLEGSEEITAYRRVVKALVRKAPREEQSRELIATRAIKVTS